MLQAEELPEPLVPAFGRSAGFTLPSGSHTESPFLEWRFTAPALVPMTTVRTKGRCKSWRKSGFLPHLSFLDARESFDDETFYARYYADSSLPKALVIQLRREVAETLKLPAAKLRPDDRFGKQIGVHWITSDDLDVLANKGRNRAKALGLTVDLHKINTLDEYIRCFAK
jgi:hypothetical protein